MEKLLELIINILSKQLIPTLVSIVGVAIITYALPETAPIRAKLGDTLFYIALFACIFITVKLIIYLYELISIKITYRKNINIRNEQIRKENKNIFDKLIADIDALKPKEREILEGFISTGNLPIPTNEMRKAYLAGGHYSSPDARPLYEWPWFDKSLIEEKGEIIEYKKLKSDIFDMLLACQKTKGSISVFGKHESSRRGS